MARLSSWAFLGGISVAAGAEWNFRTQIVPVLSKAGCNAGACHGAAAGQGGFHLSLLGCDPEEDFWNLTRAFAGRRIDLDAPGESLVLRKPARQLEHEGGRKLPRGSAGYETLLRWIEAGVPFGSPGLQVTAITVQPEDRLFPEIGGQAQLRVVAVFSDGSSRDVTSLALYNSNDDGIAEVTGAGVVTALGRGLTSIMIRFSGQVAAARIAVPLGTAAAEFPAHNFIDEEIGAELRRLGLAPAGLCGDAEFLRRAHLDITGRLPEYVTLPVDRGKVIDALLNSEAFIDFWTLQYADLLLLSGKRGSEQATAAYHHWLRGQIARNTPLDQLASALVNASGDITRVGPANFLNLASDPRDLAEHASSILLGTQIGCARCHAHPADRWTQDDYYQFAALFSQVARDGNIIGRNEHGNIEHPKTGKSVPPKLLGARQTLPADSDRQAALAQWLAAPENPFFARAMVNRVWKLLFGRGLVEPVHDLRPTNPATHPRLLDKLAANFVERQFDLRWLIRTIAASRAYQLASRAGSDNRFYSHAFWKPLSAQVLVDAIAQVMGVPDKFPATAEGTRAVQLIGAQTPSYALDVLGRCQREQACEPAASGGGLAQALHLINGTTINAKLTGGALTALLAKGQSNRAIIEEFYARAFSRSPKPSELDFWNQTFSASADRAAAAEDFLWTLLNSREFAYNH